MHATLQCLLYKDFFLKFSKETPKPYRYSWILTEKISSIQDVCMLAILKDSSITVLQPAFHKCRVVSSRILIFEIIVQINAKGHYDWEIDNFSRSVTQSQNLHSPEVLMINHNVQNSKCSVKIG